MFRHPILFIVALAVPFGPPTLSLADSPQTETQKPLVVFLVRHAEKVNSGRDPVLSEAGQQRAGMLAKTLRDAKLDHIHSTAYKRTRLTAEPVAKDVELELEEYDPRKLADFATFLRQSGGRHLVVGHSNTTPMLVKLLGGDPVSPIDDATEYDRLYLLSIAPSGACTSILMHYGK